VPRLLIVLAVLCLTLSAPAAAIAKPLIGIGDQRAASYADPKLRALPFKTARLNLAWSWQRHPWLISQADDWMAAVRAAGLRPIIAINRDSARGGAAYIPPMKQYLASFRALRARYPRVREFSAWNEPNVPGQPFVSKPKRAAAYYNAMRAACRSCTVVAGDLWDGRPMAGWLSVYRRYVRAPKVWALHNYTDANQKNGGTATFLRLTRGPVWVTEVGAVRRKLGLKGQPGGVKRIFALANSSPRIKRLYFYQWRHDRTNPWDSAFLNADGSKRPAYHALLAGLRRR
jgi:hypothetical protein